MQNMHEEIPAEHDRNFKPGFEQDSKADHETQKCQGKIQPGHEVDFQSGDEDITARKQFEASQPPFHAEKRCTAVLLRGIPGNVREDYIEMFFENKNNFSEVTVLKVEINRQEKTAVVEFEDEEASRFVLEKKSIILKKNTIMIEPYIPRTQEVTKEDAVEDDVLPKVVLKDLPDDVDQEEIEMVFQSKKRVGDIEVVEIEYNEEDSLAIVTLGNQECKPF
ncbi:uncharacterized protein LOC128210684 [Mya arenaria]|uniref:uncharacterized protein LOC128210684 n=1 Tax=Mya arenaria TaxID=6604 RepID=UPI0022E14B98|nr:uncharacterized protein LOC128210684 [Mya arenaria]